MAVRMRTSPRLWVGAHWGWPMESEAGKTAASIPQVTAYETDALADSVVSELIYMSLS